ncbi:MAG: hypothetical protein CSA22_10510 [Deltaproteobacteria bacterium]|nr:MAG: hypothetical protein CSA22_10510 [Deltaproteobacteria bacterium]
MSRCVHLLFFAFFLCGSVTASFGIETPFTPVEESPNTEASSDSAEVRTPQRASQGNGFTEPVTGMAFVWIPEGCFQMGSPENEERRESVEGPQHQVCLDGFWLGKYEVTQAQWQAVMGSNPSSFKGDDLPVEMVSWKGCQKFLKKLSAGSEDGSLYRLPTEAEWEYACRAGTTTPFSFGETISTDQANYNGNVAYGSGKKGDYREKTTQVGTFPPNAWGVFDMHGNVWEWCQDVFGKYSAYSERNPKGKRFGKYRVLRGGSWRYYPQYCRSADRGRGDASGQGPGIGFRVVRTFVSQ